MEVKILRKQVYDPYRGEFVYEIAPTTAIKRSRATAGAAGTVVNLATYSIGPGSVARMTYLHINVAQNVRQSVGAEIACIDRYGTFDKVYLQKGTADNVFGIVDHKLLGDKDRPVHTLYGTIRFNKSAVAIGTVAVSYDLIVSSGMPNREGTVTRT
jgi:hypothetical protein